MKKNNVIKLLNAYIPFDILEEQHQKAMIDFCLSNEILFSRSNHDGHFTASAILVDKEFLNVAMIWHSKLKRWLQPGGHIEETDTDIKNAALRELIEETNIPPKSIKAISSTPFDIDAHIIPENKSQKQHFHLDLRFLFIYNNDIVATENYKWVSIKELSQENDQSLSRFAKKLLKTISANK